MTKRNINPYEKTFLHLWQPQDRGSRNKRGRCHPALRLALYRSQGSQVRRHVQKIHGDRICYGLSIPVPQDSISP